ncbi:hypothetical protein ACFLRP_01510 [Bacteroidota bacterium]
MLDKLVSISEVKIDQCIRIGVTGMDEEEVTPGETLPIAPLNTLISGAIEASAASIPPVAESLS